MPGTPGVLANISCNTMDTHAHTFILGKKLGMTQVFLDDGRVAPVTLMSAGPVAVSRIRTREADGYDATQVKYDSIVREFRSVHPSTYAVGDAIDVSMFAEGDHVRLSGTSRGKGFQGGMKRHGFHGAPKTHGVKHAHRQPGSIGAGGVQKVLKGQRMAGRMGGDRVTIRRTKVVKVFPMEHMIAVQGAVPGPRGGIIEICRGKR